MGIGKIITIFKKLMIRVFASAERNLGLEKMVLKFPRPAQAASRMPPMALLPPSRLGFSLNAMMRPSMGR